MAVYVDHLQPTPPSRRGRNWRYDSYCHLLADSRTELLDFAARLGLRRSWFQDGRYPHFDLTANKRLQARRLGAVEITTKEWLRRKQEANDPLDTTTATTSR